MRRSNSDGRVRPTTTALAVCIVLSAAAVGRAQEPADAAGDGAQDAVRSGAEGPDGPGIPGYDDAIEQGLAEYNLGHYQEARVQFQRAHELAPSARTFRALGNVDFELRNYGDCVAHLQRALESQVRPLTGKIREDTEKLVIRAKVYVGEVHIDVEPGSATVSVDGVTVDRGAGGAVSLVVGDHLFEFRAQGRLTERRSVHVRGGESMRLEVTLRELPRAAQAAPSQLSAQPAGAPRQDEAKPLRQRWWLWTSVGVAVAAVAIGIGVGVARRSEPDEKPVAVGSLGAILEAP